MFQRRVRLLARCLRKMIGSSDDESTGCFLVPQKWMADLEVWVLDVSNWDVIGETHPWRNNSWGGV